MYRFCLSWLLGKLTTHWESVQSWAIVVGARSSCWTAVRSWATIAAAWSSSLGIVALVVAVLLELGTTIFLEQRRCSRSSILLSLEKLAVVPPSRFYLLRLFFALDYLSSKSVFSTWPLMFCWLKLGCDCRYVDGLPLALLLYWDSSVRAIDKVREAESSLSTKEYRIGTNALLVLLNITCDREALDFRRHGCLYS
uniref:Uncharacterized protein n=1 Tax=Ditylenchus dipsaci TaxID=166011 RepID=A0A915D0M2_9BILA